MLFQDTMNEDFKKSFKFALPKHENNSVSIIFK